MKFDKFLAALFSRKTVAIILLVVLVACCLTACELTFEDVLCLAFFGCVSFDTCQEMINECGNCVNCESDGCVIGFEGCLIEIDSCGTCAGDGNDKCFNCFWNAGLKDCNPSAICSSCGCKSKGFGCE